MGNLQPCSNFMHSLAIFQKPFANNQLKQLAKVFLALKGWRTWSSIFAKIFNAQISVLHRQNRVQTLNKCYAWQMSKQTGTPSRGPDLLWRQMQRINSDSLSFFSMPSTLLSSKCPAVYPGGLLPLMYLKDILMVVLMFLAMHISNSF